MRRAHGVGQRPALGDALCYETIGLPAWRPAMSRKPLKLVAPASDDLAAALPPGQTIHRDPLEARLAGRALRRQVARSAHASWVPSPDRPDPVSLLESQDATRAPELVPIRYGRMLASPFGFLRGSAIVMASDLAHTPVTGLTTQICGDAHLSNFGMFASPERDLVFDVNDFDETLPGPWEWDVKRLAASGVVAARAAGLSRRDTRAIAQAAARSYRAHMHALADLTTLALWYRRIDATDIAADRRSRRLLGGFLKAAQRHRDENARARLLRRVRGHLRFVDDPPLITRAPVTTEESQALQEMFAAYARSLRYDWRVLLDRYEVVDVARKVVGVGSVGTRTFVVLLVANRSAADPLILQLREADASVLEPHLGTSPLRSHAERVVDGQRVMQSVSDVFLGWSHSPMTGVDYYWRQLWDWKGSAAINSMHLEELTFYVSLCGRALALAHARGGDRLGIAGYLGTSDAFDRAIADFAEAYAEQTDRDHAALVTAVKHGRIKAEPGV